jgi:OPT oligopeptide transporter protein
MSAGEGGKPPSPRYWLLWPGIMIMLCASLAEVLVQYKVISQTTGALFGEVRKTINWKIRNGLQLKQSLASALSPSSIDSTGKPIRWWMWLPGTIAFVILTCVVLTLQYQMDIGTSVIALAFGFILSFMAIQCQGAVDQQPTTAITKAVQLVLGGVTKTQNYDVSTMQRINITGAQVSGGYRAPIRLPCRISYADTSPTTVYRPNSWSDRCHFPVASLIYTFCENLSVHHRCE